MTQPPILELANVLADPVEPAAFPKSILRFRNRRWDDAVGLSGLDDAEWTRQFSEFPPLDNNLPKPLALRYHGHQFGVYNPELGDGRGFLCAQLQDRDGRWLDLGTKGSGQTPWSRQGDGRLTLKGGVREILASTYLEALGVNTSKAFSLIETGEQLHRGDEPSPTRSAVLVRLSHSHIRFGTFQRLAWLKDETAMSALVEHVITHYYPELANLAEKDRAPAMLEAITGRAAKMVGQWMGVGFVHGVMNTDNFNITGETFDFGPYRFLPKSDPNLTAAYFDHQGLYRFGRQPYQGLWALQQLAGALSLIADEAALIEALAPYETAYQDSFVEKTLAMLGLAHIDRDADLEFVATLFAWMTEAGVNWPQFFFDWFGGADSLERIGRSPQKDAYEHASFAQIRSDIVHRTSTAGTRLGHSYFEAQAPVSLLYDEIEALWAPIADSDDWSALAAKLDHIDAARDAYGFSA